MKQWVFLFLLCFSLFAFSALPVLQVDLKTNSKGEIIKIEGIKTTIAEPTKKPVVFDYVLNLEMLEKTEKIPVNAYSNTASFLIEPVSEETFKQLKTKNSYPEYLEKFYSKNPEIAGFFSVYLPFKIGYSKLEKISVLKPLPKKGFLQNSSKSLQAGTEIYSLNVKGMLCNYNNKCGKTETYISCPQDCRMEKDHICTPFKDDICDKDCLKGIDPDCKKTKQKNQSGNKEIFTSSLNNEGILAYALFAILLLAAFFILFNIRKRKVKV